MESDTIALIMPNREEIVYEGKECPICACRMFAFERHNIRAGISNVQSYCVEEYRYGEIFNLMCECGLEFSMHVDDLTDRVYAGHTTEEMDRICDNEEKMDEALRTEFVKCWSKRV